MRLILHMTVLAALSCGAAEAAMPPAGPIRLAPHRVVYDLSLASARGMRGLESAHGRIAYDFSGDACQGYTLKFRQVTVIRSREGGDKISDLRSANFESGDGQTFRFRNDNAVEGGPRSSVDGAAERRRGGPLSIRLKTPKRQDLSAPSDAVFPNVQMKEIIAAAREGRAMLPLRLFDGSDDGRKVYETLAVIGSRIEPGQGDALEPAARQDGLAKLARWPVTVSYFEPGRADRTPVYTLGFDLYENGVSRALRLDYGDFTLRGEMTRLELLPEPTSCPR